MIFQSANSIPCDVGNLEDITAVIQPIQVCSADNMGIDDMEIMRMRIENLERVVEELCEELCVLIRNDEDLSVEELYNDWS